MTNTKNIPNLRFPEFSGEWEVNRLGDCSTKVGSGSTPRGGEKVYLDEGVLFIRSQNVNDNKLILDDARFIPESINNKMKGSIVKPLDILLNITGASLGRSCVVPLDFETGNVNQHVSIIRLKENYNPYFIQAYLSSFKGQKTIIRSQVGSGREGLNFSSIRLLKLALPTLPEQQKIANFLTAIDEKINLLTRKHTALQAYKKGVMQQIFNQTIRFKKDDGGEFGAWREVQLKDILNYEQPTRYIVSNTEYDDSYETPVLTAGKTFILGYTNETNNILKNHPVIIFDDFTTAYKYVDFDFKVKSSAMKILKPIDEKINLKYIFEAMGIIRFPLGEHKRYWISEYSYMKIPYPPEEEQQKIANFLTTLDTKISQTAEQLERVQAYKRGLLQGMFV